MKILAGGAFHHRKPKQAPATVAATTAALDAALLEAAWDELGEVGYPGFTLDGVAARAGTSRPVLARRWPNRAELVIAAMRHHAPSAVIERAVERGEIDPRRLTPHIASLPVDLVRQYLIMNLVPVPDDTLVEIVDRIFLPLVQARRPDQA
jgi:AcrR family transcriptional regulator